ncbi:hypothetical protein C2G38_2153708 [Gigaspora rosea]|uniref:C2H2-type domain-containing protein n=1 Tax=Gigaspora rosea TaxID=44941 RepID=A0A397W5T1_9GLOM|nr:hypothetical protein C2G38_2153708 [Gigaspora rosea]
MTNNQAISANDDQVNVSVGYPIVFIPYMAIQQSFECKTCKVIYQTRKGLTRHQNAEVSLKNILSNQENKLLHFRIWKACFLEFLRAIFITLILEMVAINAFFHGPNAYLQLTNILNNSNWGYKFFDNDHQTFVELFNAQAEKKANCNLFDKNRLPKLTVEWKMKIKRDAKNNQTSAGYIYLSFYTQQI